MHARKTTEWMHAYGNWFNILDITIRRWCFPCSKRLGEFLLSLIRGNSRNKESDLHHHRFELAGNHQLAGLGTEVLLGRRRHWFSQFGENLRWCHIISPVLRYRRLLLRHHYVGSSRQLVQGQPYFVVPVGIRLSAGEIIKHSWKLIWGRCTHNLQPWADWLGQAQWSPWHFVSPSYSGRGRMERSHVFDSRREQWNTAGGKTLILFLIHHFYGRFELGCHCYWVLHCHTFNEISNKSCACSNVAALFL